jgi:hypothetical protein
VQSAATAQDKLEWTDNYKLTLDDFLANPPSTGTIQTVQGHTFIEYKFSNYELLGSKNFNKNVTCYFLKTASWIDKGENTGKLLGYAQAVFDMNEWMARELRKRFRENKKLLLAGKQNEIYEKLAAEFANIQSRYSKETEYGSIQSTQMEWETKIEDELTKLADYCKTCKPARRK